MSFFYGDNSKDLDSMMTIVKLLVELFGKKKAYKTQLTCFIYTRCKWAIVARRRRKGKRADQSHLDLSFPLRPLKVETLSVLEEIKHMFSELNSFI